ncbi:MAG: FAD-dependent oxidoreductase [Ruminococcaceae bacterium]|nr:FAD-dependent oxidoreductase [Oscillospiraceae bacterium]
MESIWEQGLNMPSFPSLKEDISCDVLIIGGGIAGILCGYMLKNAGVDYVILESDKICNKTTRFTTAKITSLHGFIYSRLIKEFGISFARLYYDANEDAILEYKNIAKNIDCDFEITDNYIYSFTNKEKINKEYEAIKSLGIDALYEEKIALPFETAGGIKFKNQAEFNPLKFLSKIAKDLNIFENSKVEKVKKNFAYTSSAKIEAKKIIFATHFPLPSLKGLYFAKMYQEKSYAIAFKCEKKIKGCYIDDKSELSIRDYNGYIILGGQKHRTGKKSGGWKALEDYKELYFPGNKTEYMWATEDTITLDGVPYIGKIDTFSNDKYVITGFNKWGMTSSMLGAKLLCDIILNRENKYEKIFSPQRSILRKQLLVNACESTKNLLSFSTPRCTHLGCKLVWNKNEHTWDCPCHGSKFDKSGDILNGPANKNLNL